MASLHLSLFNLNLLKKFVSYKIYDIIRKYDNIHSCSAHAQINEILDKITLVRKLQ